MAYDLAKVTANGNNLIAQILANKSSLSVDKIEISDTQLPSTTDISTMTSVPKVVQTVSANGFSKNSNTLIISTVVDNSSIRADYKAWVFGIWGSDSQNGQSQLIAVITSTNSPDTIPAFSGRTPVSYTYKFNIGFSNASQIQFNMIDDSFATNDTVVHTTGDETIDGQKKFDTDPTDGAGNAYAKTVDVNQQLDKKVNIADMRKPASDVAGIDEVNAKQDKIAYTPADDSKVVHDNHDGTINVNGTSFTPAMLDSAAGKNAQPINTDVDTLTKPGLYYVSESAPNNPFKTLMMLETKIQYDWNHFEEIQISYELGDKSGMAIRWVNPKGNFQGINVASPWVLLSDDSKVIHRDPNTGNTSEDVNFMGKAQKDYKDLLTADQLPPDLARTGSDQEYTGKNTFDTAPIDKTTGNPYITKDGVPAVPSTLADTTKPANFTAGLQSGGVSVATSDDLKSVENSAWHIMSGSSDKLKTYNCWYKINKDKKRLEIIVLGVTNETPYTNSYTVLDLSSIITSISSFSGQFNIFEKSGVITNNSIHIEGAKLASSTPIDVTGLAAQIIYDGVRDSEYGQSGDGDGTGNPAYVYYNDLQDAYK